MIKLVFGITEKDGTASVRIINGSEQPTQLELDVLESECNLGFARHSDAMQRLAKAVVATRPKPLKK